MKARHLRRDGFTLVELMIVVAIIGILAAIAIPAFLSYLRKSKISEAMTNLEAMSKGALAFHHGEKHKDQEGMTAESKKYPASDSQVCTNGAAPDSRKVYPDVALYEQQPWSDLKFSIGKPHYFQYCYESTPERKEFAAFAQAALDSADPDVFFCMIGQTEEEHPIIGRPYEIDNPADCAPLPAGAGSGGT